MTDTDEDLSPTLTFAAPKAGWCNGCSRRPPYEPNKTYALKCKTLVLTLCPICARDVVGLFTNLIAKEGETDGQDS